MKPKDLLDTYLPEYEFSEFHKVKINASPERVFEAIKSLSMKELSPLAHLMFSIRELPVKLIAKNVLSIKDDKPMLESMYNDGFIQLHEEPDQEIVFGLIGEFWKLDGGQNLEIKNPQEFLDYSNPAYAKIVANLAITANADDNTVTCSTETRIHAPDHDTRKKFAFYWRIISMGSGLIRIFWLKAIKHRAEK